MIGQPFRTCDLTGQKLLPLKYVMECVHMHMFAGSGWDRRCVMAGAVVEDKRVYRGRRKGLFDLGSLSTQESS